MNKTNQDVRTAAKKAGVMLWQVAKQLEISEATMTRRLRTELTPADKTAFLGAVEKLTKRGERND